MKEYFYFRNGRLYRVEKIERETFLECSQEFTDYIKNKLSITENKQIVLKRIYNVMIEKGAKIKE